MPFEKGNKLSKGRPKSSKNKTNTHIRDNFLKLLESNLDTMQEDLNQLEPDKRLRVILDLANFIIPKLKSVELEDISENNEPKILELKAEELEHIKNSIKERY